MDLQHEGGRIPADDRQLCQVAVNRRKFFSF
jgi:hypothetical protein